MRKCWLLIAITSLLVLLVLTGANAWLPEGVADTWDDLPEAVRALLPSDETLVYGLYNSKTYFVLLEAEDNVRTAYVLWPQGTDGAYSLELKSAPLPPIDGSAASIGSNGEDFLYLIYDGGGSYFTFSRQSDGAWLLSGVQAMDEFGFSSIFGLTVHGQDSNTYCLPGKTPDYNLATVDVHTLPKLIEDAIKLVDTEGFAMVKSDVSTDRLHLRASPSKQAVSLGRYYSGTPVHVHSIDGDWAKVDVCGVEGYMMTDFLTFGQDMLSVKRYFPSLTLREEDAEAGVPLYMKPETTDSLYVGTVGGHLNSTIYILASVGEDWFHVACVSGLTGYIQSKYFWPGNG